MKARAYCAHPSTRDHWALRYMSRYPDQVVSLQVFKSPSKLGTHLSTHCNNTRAGVGKHFEAMGYFSFFQGVAVHPVP
ncbi:hypothetical protein TNCV_2623681, partial [Trichonephila clavipes]